MKFMSSLIVVLDMEKSKKFYHDVLGLEVIVDFGANVTLTGGICLQTRDSWIGLINKKKDEIHFGSNAGELYFEEDNFDSFIRKLDDIKEVKYLHSTKEHSWGQRVIRFYDPDKHIIEVGENMVTVVRRFISSGLSIEETAKRMDVPVDYVKSCIE